ncbi:MAG: hypothetical protein MK108_07595 [Mariniblastus sp.]|nr:hypothetical protein [Mariniblastus sp.]
MKLKYLFCMFLAATVSLSTLPVEAWSQSSASDNNAVVRFDFNLKRLRQNPLVGNAGADQMLQQMLPPQQATAIDLKKIERIYGGMEAPASIQKVQGIMMAPSPPDKLPINFFIRVVFSDKDAANAMLDSLKENGRAVESNGKTYIAPPPNEPQNMRAHLVDANTFELGTTDYVTRSNRDVFTKALNAHWDLLPKTDAVRIAADVGGMQALFDEGMGMARDQAPPAMMGLVQMGQDLAGLSVSMDMDSKQMLSVAFVAKDSKGAENMEDGLNGLLGLAKMQAQQGMAMLQDDQKAAAKQVMDALNAKAEGNAVMIQIPKPDGFEEMIGGMMQGLGPGADF